MKGKGQMTMSCSFADNLQTCGVRQWFSRGVRRPKSCAELGGLWSAHSSSCSTHKAGAKESGHAVNDKVHVGRRSGDMDGVN